MSFRVTYTRLFVCDLWHAFHLNLGADVQFHDLDPVADAAAREDLLRTYDLRNFIDIRPLGDTALRMTGHRMKFRASPTGFFAGLATIPDPVAGRRPMIEPATNQRWHFGLYPRNLAGWTNATNQRMETNLPAIHYYTNNRPDWVVSASAPLSLAAPAVALQERSYEAGEIVADAVGQRFRALRVVANPGIPLTDINYWEPEAPAHAETTDADRCLLPTRFAYKATPKAGETLTSLTVRLLDLGGADVVLAKTHQLTFGMDRINIDFTDPKLDPNPDPDPDPPANPVHRPIPDPGWYDLVITSDNTTYATTHRVFIDDEIYDPNAWGVVGLGPTAIDPSLRLLEADGTLRRNGAITEPPSFEIRLANRRTFWRYVAHPTQTLPVAAGFILDADARLVTTSAQPLTRFGAPLLLNGGNGPIDLPNPPPDALRPDTDGRLYSDSYLSILDL